MKQNILVIGATGLVGRYVVKELAERDVLVKAATRTPEQYQQQDRVQAIQFEFDEPAIYSAALQGIDRVFLQTKTANAVPQETLNPFIDQAKASGVHHIVLMTARGVEQAEDAGLRKVEKHVMASGAPYTILRPNWFMQNFYPGFLYPTIKEHGTIYLSAGDGKSSFVDTRDIAAVAATVLTEDGHQSKEYALTGKHALSYQECAEILSQVSGREIRYVPVSDDDLRQALSGAGWQTESIEFMVGLFYTVRQGWAAGISPDVPSILGRAAVSFEQFAHEFADAWT